MPRPKLHLLRFCLPVVLLLTGCKRQELTLNLNADGSGQVEVRLHLNRPVSSGLAETWPEDLKREIDAATDEVRRTLQGPLRPNTEAYRVDADGWPGKVVTWTFTDLNEVSIQPPGGDQMGFRFRMILGETANVRVDALWPAVEKIRQGPQFTLQMADLMKPLVADARLRVRVQTATRLLESKHAPRVGLDDVLLLDIQPEKALGYEAVVKVLHSGTEEELRALPALQREGLLLPPADRPVTFQF